MFVTIKSYMLGFVVFLMNYVQSVCLLQLRMLYFKVKKSFLTHHLFFVIKVPQHFEFVLCKWNNHFGEKGWTLKLNCFV